MPEWFKDWFNTPYYHILYRHRDDREAKAFIDRLVEYLNPPAGAHFLDVACGRGRHSIYLNDKGFDVTGIDISPHSIGEAKEQENEHLHFYVADMRQPLECGDFDIAVNLFTSFGYFDDRTDNLLTLQNVYAALKPGGRFVLDYFNATKILKNLVPKDTKTIEGIDFHIQKRIEEGRIVKTITFNDEGEEHSYMEKVEARNKDDFERLFTKTPFTVLNIFGNYRLEPFDAENSDRLIILAQKQVE